MSIREISTVFTITTPSVSVTLGENRIGEVPFTVTNVSNRKLRARVRITPAPGTPAGWFSVVGDSEHDFEAGAARQFVVRVDPPLGAPAGTYNFRLDAIGIERPDDDYSEGPSCQVTVPPSTPTHLTTPRGYITTLVGAIAGGAGGELLVVIASVIIYLRERHCEGWACLGVAFLLVLLVLLGYVVMLVGAALGAGIALLIRRYQGWKLTATFLGVLMVPWTLLIFFAVLQFIHNIIVIAVISPLLLVAVPAVLARGGVLLIRTHHI